MKEIQIQEIKQAVKRLCIEANVYLPKDVFLALKSAENDEPWPSAKESLLLLEDNLKVAEEKQIPICQDTGSVSVFAELGSDVHILGDFNEAVNAGVREAYEEAFLRKSIAADPIRRGNTGDNTPAFITVELVKGSDLKLTVMPKGCGSENMSRMAMLKPADGENGVVDFVVETVRKAGSNPCPPTVIGVGIGGTFDKAPLLAKKALLRPLDTKNSDPYYADLETRIFKEINKLGIGPQGFGGKTTCLGVQIETMPTHVAGLPVAVNISCHATRRASCTL